MGWAAVVVCAGAGFVEPRGTATVEAIGCDDPVKFGDAICVLGVRHVVVAVPAGLERRAHPALTLTAFRWPELRFARLLSPHVPLALHAALAAARSGAHDPGLAPAFVEAFAAHTWSGLWTSSVARLPRPAASRPQYLRSLLPRSSFLVGCHPQEWIHRAQDGPGSLAPGLSRTLLSDGGPLPSPLGEQLMTASGASQERSYPVPGDWGDLYGGSTVTQLALVPDDADLGHVTAFGDCDSCGNRVGTPVCPYCRIHVRPLSPALGSQPSRPLGGHS